MSLVGGALTDRLPKRNLLVITQVLAGVLALLLGLLVTSGRVQYWQVLVIAGMLGTVNSFYTPARQAFVPELVDKHTLQNAIALNSTLFNGARVVGPAVGGLLIASLGLGLNFYLNALSYVAVIAGLLMIRQRPARVRENPVGIIRDVGEGLEYVRATPSVLTILILIGSASLFAMNFTTLLPLIAQNTLRVGSSGFGFLTAAMGVGSLCGAISLVFLKRRDLSRRFIYAGITIFTLMEIALAFSRTYALDVVLLMIIGISMNLFTTTANTRVLSVTPSRLQGRVMSVYSLMFLGVTPFGSLFAGIVAEHWGAPVALLAGGAITLTITIGVFLARRGRRPEISPAPA